MSAEIELDIEKRLGEFHLAARLAAPASGITPASGAPLAIWRTAKSAKKRWWLTITMSDSWALRRISVTKQRW